MNKNKKNFSIIKKLIQIKDQIEKKYLELINIMFLSNNFTKIIIYQISHY